MLFHTAIILTAKGSNAFADFPPENSGKSVVSKTKGSGQPVLFLFHLYASP